MTTIRGLGAEPASHRHPLLPISVEAFSLNQLVAMLALQFVLHALSWALGAWMLPQQRPVLIQWSAFLAFVGLGFVLMTQRDDTRSWLAFNGAALCWLAGLLMLWRGVEKQFKVRSRGTWRAALLAVAVLLHLAVGPGAEHAVPRVVLSYLCNALAAAGMLHGLRREIFGRYGRLRGALFVLPAFIVLSVFLLLALRQLLDPGKALELHRFEPTSVRSMYAYLVAAAIFNFSFMALVVGQLTGQLRQLVERDALTGLYNRRALRDRLDEQWSRWQREQLPFAVVALDLDHFKRVNDTHGHAVGDQVLEQVAAVLRDQVRLHDVVARMGGEEFVVLLPQASLDHARGLGLRLCERLRQQALPAGPAGVLVTASIGLAVVGPADADVDGVLRRADDALYRAKSAGRDQVQEAVA